MKQLIFILILALGSTTARAQDTPSTNEGKTMQAAAKEHVCTEACKKAGHHVYAHGEKGHVCSEECMKMHEGMEKKGMEKKEKTETM